jgi:hypothetical protein
MSRADVWKEREILRVWLLRWLRSCDGRTPTVTLPTVGSASVSSVAGVTIATPLVYLNWARKKIQGFGNYIDIKKRAGKINVDHPRTDQALAFWFPRILLYIQNLRNLVVLLKIFYV